MKSSHKSWWKIGIVCGLGLAAGLATTFRAQADEWNKRTILTVNQPIQISDTYLDPGTYVLKLYNSQNERHTVYIFNERENHLINTVMAVNNYQLQPTGNSRFTFWETPPGTARAMRAWFYPGDNYGQEFKYPGNLRQIAQATPPPPAPVAVAPEPAPEQPAPTVAEAAPPAPEPPAQEPEVVAQNTPPPPPPPAAEPTPAPAPAPAETPTELPKTATPYPLIGLGGLLSLGLYTLVRMKTHGVE